MSANGIKTEDGSGSGGAYIKPEHEADEYEDTGECQMPANQHEQDAWLAKLPKWLWQAWNETNEDQEVELGKIRIYNQPNPDGSMKFKLRLHDTKHHKDVPKLYDMNMTRSSYNNTVVFSERDQPGFKAWNPNRVKNTNNRDSNYRVHKPNKPYTSSIPKQTALAGFIKHEVSVTAVENEEYRRKIDQRFTQLFQPKRTTTYHAGVDTNMHSSISANQAFSSFVRATQSKKPKKQQEKAVRISQEELLDLLVDCFKQFRYWSLKALKQRLHQPEAYIKSSVEKIATLMRSGRFAMNYKLNPEYERSLNIDTSDVKEEAAEEGEGEGDDYEDDDGADDDFEDVKMDES